MRHLKAGRRLGVTTSHRKAMMRNLVTSVIEHGKIKTTVARAKEMRKYLDKMIGLGKDGSLHARRQAISFLKTKESIAKLFDELGPMYKDRNGGYSRIYKIGNRLGDNAQMAIIELVEQGDEKTEAKTEAAEPIAEITEELKEETKVEEPVSEEEKVESKEDSKEEAKEK